MPKIIAMSGPSTRLGMHSPVIASTMLVRSSSEFGLSAAMAPSGMPNASAMSNAGMPIAAETGNPCAMISSTPRPGILSDSGKLKVA